MSHLIAAGGTGQEVASAVTRLAYLAGAEFPQIIVIDSDIAPNHDGAKLTRHQALNELHASMMKLGVESTRFLSTVNPAHAVAGGTPQAVHTVGDVFSVNGNLSPDDRALLELFLTPQQLRTSVNDGFHGHPAIGALVVAVSSNTGEWARLRDTLTQKAMGESGVRVVVTGSVTGGVGTATLPAVIHQLAALRTNGGRASISGLFQLPWFTLVEVQGDSKTQAADVTDRMMDRNAACLVRGYLEQLIATELDVALLLGLPERVVRPSDGGSRQRETRHYLNVIAGIQGLCLLDESEHRRLVGDRRGLFGMTLGQQPSDHFAGHPGGPAFKGFTVEKFCAVARCLVALSEALCFELQTLTPASTHQANIHRILKQLSHNEREALKKAALDFQDLHHEVWSWLGESLEARVGENRADTIQAFEPDRRDARKGWDELRDSSVHRALRNIGAPASFLAFGRRLLGHLGPFEVDREQTGIGTAWAIVHQARTKLHGQILRK
jgi:hypothetical protein